MAEEKKTNAKIINSEDARKAKSNKQKRRIRFFTVVIAAVVFLIVVIGMLTGGYEAFLDCVGIARNVELRPVGVELPCPVGAVSICKATKDTIVIYDENGVTGYSPDGVWKWNTQCSFANPVLQSYNNFALLTDIGGHLIWAFDTDGIAWKYNFDNKVTGVFLSRDEKILYVIHDTADFLSAVSEIPVDSISKGEPRIRYTRKFVSYHSLCVAQNSQQVVVTGMYTDVSTIVGTVCFLKSSDGSEYATQIFDGEMFVKAFFTENNSLFLANSDKLLLLRKSITASSDNDIEKVVWAREGKPQELVDITTLGKKYCVVVYRKANNDTEDNISEVIYYNSDGQQEYKFGINGSIQGIISNDSTICLYTDRFVYMFDNKARLVGKYESDFEVTDISYISNTKLLVQGDSRIACVSYEEE